MKMKNKDVIALWNTIFEFSNKSGTKFAYALLRTKQKLKPLIRNLQMLQLPTKAFAEFDMKRVALCSKFSDKDEDGNPIQKDGNFVITANVEEFQVEYAALSEQYKDSQAEMDEKVKKYNDILEEEVEVELYKISLEHCPTSFTPVELESIMVLIDDGSSTETLH